MLLTFRPQLERMEERAVPSAAQYAPPAHVLHAFVRYALVKPPLTAAQHHRADQLVSTFENSTPVIQYGYIENIHDGRGYTAGRAGFTTATGDFLDVVERYTKKLPGNG